MNVAWSFAAQLLGYKSEQRKKGWPENLSLAALAHLQACVRADSKEQNEKNRVNNWKAAILDAVSSGDLQGEAFQYQRNRLRIAGQSSRPRTFNSYKIKPTDFAGWLKDQCIEPSEHVRNWFESQGVSFQSAQILPLPTTTEPEKLTEYESLIAYRASNPNTWPAEHSRIIAQRYEQGKDGSLPKVSQEAMGKKLGCSKQNIRAIIEKYQNEQATPLKKSTSPWRM